MSIPASTHFLYKLTHSLLISWIFQQLHLLYVKLLSTMLRRTPGLPIGCYASYWHRNLWLGTYRHGAAAAVTTRQHYSSLRNYRITLLSSTRDKLLQLMALCRDKQNEIFTCKRSIIVITRAIIHLHCSNTNGIPIYIVCIHVFKMDDTNKIK